MPQFTKQQYQDQLAYIGKLVNEIKEARELLTMMRKRCNHAWIYEGHGHKDGLYRCEHCDETEWR
jgi:hypothetical protein